VRWAMDIERMGELRIAGNVYAGENEGKRPLGRHRGRGKASVAFASYFEGMCSYPRLVHLFTLCSLLLEESHDRPHKSR
jgi:hypothetical protein